MKGEEIYIRIAVPEDAEQLLEIYAPYVEKTAITFEYEVPDIKEFRERIQKTLEKYPYLVVQSGKEILGYAYTGVFREREAYDWAAEVSIYIKENKRKEGLGRKLYSALEGISQKQNLLNLNACIAYPEREDSYLTCDSVQFHAHSGYRMVGQFHQCGYKFGTWYHMVWMEKIIGAHTAYPNPIIRFSELDRNTLYALGIQEYLHV